ncbi:MAG TPA: hypothetical protein VFQ48_04360 [Pseudonocardiaceae bacterium]|nr:hypothetical protein [Pseudonocardiaceae bacterium]
MSQRAWARWVSDRVGGDQHLGQRQRRQQRNEVFDLVRFLGLGDPVLADERTEVMHQRPQQVHLGLGAGLGELALRAVDREGHPGRAIRRIDDHPRVQPRMIRGGLAVPGLGHPRQRGRRGRLSFPLLPTPVLRALTSSGRTPRDLRRRRRVQRPARHPGRQRRFQFIGVQAGA